MEWLKLKDITVGFIRENVFHTYRKPQHFMRKWGGFGISAQILKELINRNVREVAFIYDGVREKALFKTTTSKIVSLGIVEYDSTFGFQDKQYFIPTKEMHKEAIKPELYERYFCKR